jgi:EAL domain-containing protein (putative c-di-GMP-specific phosphodiesterase class I)/GGDEF domain-containing protein
MFKRLSTRLTVLYAGLFGAVLLTVSLAVYFAISSAAQHQVRAELAGAGAVFERVWSLRSDRLGEGANLLSRDFGFREAAATGDAPTIASALENLRRRMGIDLAFMVDSEGRVIGADFSPADKRDLARAFELADDPSGVFMLGGEPYQLVSAPVLSPELIGWVVFAVRLDQGEMDALERLSAIPLQATVLHRTARGAWNNPRAAAELNSARVGRFIDGALKEPAAPRVLDLASGRAIALVRRLPSTDHDGGAVLLLRYPLALALAPYRPLLVVVVLLGLVGLAVVGWGSWALARGVTRPISELDEAAQRVQRGEEARVTIDSADEIGRLAESFNTMAAEIRERERRITHLALHDEETGLPNRLALERTAPDRAAAASRRIYLAALGFDRFGHMRAAIGHKLAAQAVRMVGNRLAGLLPGCALGRVSNDVLGFVLEAEDETRALETAGRLLAALEQPVQVGGEAVDVALSIGLAALAPDRAGQAIERAVVGLDQARAARRKAAVFDAEAYGDPAANLSLMSSLIRGLGNGELTLWHQPKFDVRRRVCAGTEALVRWNHPGRGTIFPDLFIPMAEETGHIRALTEWAVTRAIADQKALWQAGHELPVAVNISGRVLGEADFLDFCEATVKDAVGPLCFEITETAVIENPEVALAMLDRFADLGLSISIDDFGAGLSSLAYLKRIRGHELKIDRSIVQDVGANQRDALIVRSTVDLAHSLGLKVVAEGVETNAVYSVLAGMGCDCVQGYLIARPQPLSELFEFLAQDPPQLRSHG